MCQRILCFGEFFRTLAPARLVTLSEAAVVRPSVRQRRLHSYDEALRLYARPNLGRLKLASVTPIEIRDMLVKLRDRGLSPRTVRKAHEVLRNALEQAVADSLIP